MRRRTAAPAGPLSRRAAIGGVVGLPLLLSACGGAKPSGGGASSPDSSASAKAFADAVAAFEESRRTEIGVFAVDAGSGRTLEHRADQRFMMCSTFKAALVGAVLRKAPNHPGLLDRAVAVPQDAGAAAGHAPFGTSRLGRSATVAELCKAAIQVSDNIAANLLIDFLGGTPEVTAFFRSLGDITTRLDRREEAMSDGDPKDLLDTTTPRASATTLRELLLGDALPAPQRAQLGEWMASATTGAECIRAGLPPEWKIADKTGSGARGERHDIAVAWPSGGKPPLVLAILTRAQDKGKKDDKILADVAAEAKAALGL